MVLEVAHTARQPPSLGSNLHPPHQCWAESCYPQGRETLRPPLPGNMLLLLFQNLASFPALPGPGGTDFALLDLIKLFRSLLLSWGGCSGLPSLKPETTPLPCPPSIALTPCPQGSPCTGPGTLSLCQGPWVLSVSSRDGFLEFHSQKEMTSFSASCGSVPSQRQLGRQDLQQYGPSREDPGGNCVDRGGSWAR